MSGLSPQKKAFVTPHLPSERKAERVTEDTVKYPQASDFTSVSSGVDWVIHSSFMSLPKFSFFFFHRAPQDIRRGIQCLNLLVLIPSEASFLKFEVAQLGYHDNQSGSASPDALCPVAQHCPPFHYWEYWKPVWEAREWWARSPALQTWMDVESILSAGRIHRKRPPVRWKGKESGHSVCRLITELCRDAAGWN